MLLFIFSNGYISPDITTQMEKPLEISNGTQSKPMTRKKILLRMFSQIVKEFATRFCDQNNSFVPVHFNQSSTTWNEYNIPSAIMRKIQSELSPNLLNAQVYF